MAQILDLYHLTYGHIEAVAEGVRSAEGSDVVICRVPELVRDGIARQPGYKLDQEAEIATVAELASDDAIIIQWSLVAQVVKNLHG